MRRKKKAKEPVIMELPHTADAKPTYEEDEKRQYERQGKVSFMDEFYTLYRRWVKNE